LKDFSKILKIKFHKNPFSGSHENRRTNELTETDGQTRLKTQFGERA